MGHTRTMRAKAGTYHRPATTTDPVQDLTPDTDAVYAKYWTVIAHLVEGKSMIETAQRCGINVRTLRRWMQTPEFKDEYNQTKREHFDIVANRLAAHAVQAADTILDMMHNGDPMMKLRAAKTIIQIAQRNNEIAERSQKINELKRQNADQEALIEELEAEVAELHENSETLVEIKSKLTSGDFIRPDWIPQQSWERMQGDFHRNTA